MNQNEITLDALRKKKLQTEIEESKQVEEVEEINKKVETISEEDRNKINSLKTNINLLDSEVSTTYGVAAQKNLSTFSDTILNNIRTKDTGEVGELMTDLMEKVSSLDIENIGEKRIFR